MRYIKIFTLAIITIFWTQSSFAQFYIGGKVGYSGNKAHYNPTLDLILPKIKFNHGFTAGIVGGYTFNEYFDLQTELSFTQKGFVIKENADSLLFRLPVNLGVDIRSRFNYLELPILAKGKIGNDKVKAYIAIGPQLGFLTNARLKAIANVILPIKLVDTKLNVDNSGFSRFDFSGVGALGVQFDLGPVNLFFEGRYTHSFVDFYKIPLGGVIEIESNIQNRNLAASVGLTVPLGNGSGTSTKVKTTKGRF